VKNLFALVSTSLFFVPWQGKKTICCGRVAVQTGIYRDVVTCITDFPNPTVQ
jgi:hypothetical protein